MHICYFCVLAVSTLLHPTLSIRLTSAKETDLAQTEEPYEGPDPWTEIPCDFDGYSTCGWTNEHGIPDDFDWRLGERRDSLRNRKRQKTGVKNDHGGGGGYMYIQSGRSRNRTAKLTTGFFKLTEPGCLKFYYHMRGRHMGHLKLYEFVTQRTVSRYFEKQMDKYRVLWSVYGNQGQNWQQGVVPISNVDPSLRKRLIFEAYDWDAGVAGNIILDDITFNPIQDGVTCNFLPLDAAPPETTTIPATTATSPPSTPLGETSRINMGSVVTAAELPTTNHTTTYPVPHPPQSTTRGRESAVTRNAVVSEEIASSVMTNRPSTATTTMRTERPTLEEKPTPRNEEPETKPKGDGPAIYIVVGIVCAILVAVVALVLYWRHKRRNQFTYYDNCTVHMTRMTQDATDPKDAVMQYYKLTDSDMKY